MTTVAAEFNYDIFYICCKLFQLSTTKPIATQLASSIFKVHTYTNDNFHRLRFRN